MSKLSKLTDFLDRLDAAQLHYTLTSVTEGAITVAIAAEQERWEVEFASDGEIEVQIFATDGDVHDFSLVEELFARHGEDPG